ncbi:MAG: hypothetical protein HZB38_00750 [Planctomycetes bacterium]|nr:hypothetical protein [Planctomycetota bacterium]
MQRRLLTFDRIVCGVCAILLTTSTAVAQGYDLSWYTIDGGGETYSLGGGYELGGTIGQPDAGAAMTGGGYELSGGFWPGVSGAPCTGDLNGDRLVDLIDLSTLLGHFGIQSGATLAEGDVNGDGRIDLTDLTMLLGEFGTICP